MKKKAKSQLLPTSVLKAKKALQCNTNCNICAALGDDPNSYDREHDYHPRFQNLKDLREGGGTGAQGVTDRYFVSSYWTFCPVIWLFGDVEL